MARKKGNLVFLKIFNCIFWITVGIVLIVYGSKISGGYTVPVQGIVTNLKSTQSICSGARKNGKCKSPFYEYPGQFKATVHFPYTGEASSGQAMPTDTKDLVSSYATSITANLNIPNTMYLQNYGKNFTYGLDQTVTIYTNSKGKKAFKNKKTKGASISALIFGILFLLFGLYCIPFLFK